MNPGHTLTTSEQLAFLVRHPVVAARVGEFQSIADTIGYDQAPTPPGGFDFWNFDVVDYWLRQLPGWIPTWGVAVPDEVWVNVVIFPDAVGNLRYTGVDVVPADINLPYPVPLNDPAPPWKQALDFALILGAGYVALEVYKEVRR